MHTLAAQGTHPDALHHSIIKHGTQRVIIAHGPGIWQPGCTSTGSHDNAGARLALMLPDAKGEINHVPSGAVGDLPCELARATCE